MWYRGRQIKWDIYFAGPLFTQGELAFNYQIARDLRFIGYKIFLPQEHPTGALNEIFDRNLENLLKSKMMIAICDGSDMDSGTAWEVGHFFGKGRIFGLRTDIRKGADDLYSGVNLMISQSADVIFISPDKIINSMINLRKGEAWVNL